MTQYSYVIKPKASREIVEFYKNVANKYKHTYSYEDFMSNVREAVFSIYGIEKTLMRRVPTISRWKNYHMAHSGKWYYAYIIDDDTIFVVDACHAQNMK